MTTASTYEEMCREMVEEYPSLLSEKRELEEKLLAAESRLKQVDMTRPFLAVDIVCVTEEGLVLIERKWPPLGFALPGGHVDYGESTEAAAIREMKEETGLDIKIIRMIGVYSEPTRDPRKHTISVAYMATARGIPKAADDAKSIKVVKAFEDLKESDLCFDHYKILTEAMSLLISEMEVR